TGDCGSTFAGGFIYTYWAPRTGKDPTMLSSDPRCPNDPNCFYQWFRVSGRHPQVFMVCMGDGSVRPIKKTIDYNTWVVLGGKADGFVLSGNAN
ncbi:MAG: DUF1559 domain-containing protein, partial [Zavarzinella sp.]|nr:DUF1559 domain-containing protein [Zavarzinella sp.]